MAFLVGPKSFKEILSGRSVRDVYERMIRVGITNPEIISKVVGNQILISGNFYIEDNLIFEAGENYDLEIIFDGGTYKNIIFRGGTFKKIVFRRGEFNGYVSIRGGHIENLVLLGGIFNHWLGTLNGVTNFDNDKKQLAEEDLKINRFEIEGGTYANNIWLSGGSIDRLEIKCVTPVKIHCKPNDDKVFDTEANQYKIQYNSAPVISDLIISRYSNKENFFHFSELNLSTLKFENFTNIGNITIAKVALKKHIHFENSDLGKTTFIDCDFSNQKMVFDSSKITEVGLAGTQLPDADNIQSTSTNISNRMLQKRLALSQIKKAYHNMGDSVHALKYHRDELTTYMNTLKFGWEKINLCLNGFTNKHGQSWGRALIVLLIGSTSFFTAYCIALGFKFNPSSEGWKIMFKNLGLLLEFINPIRKSDFLPKVLIGTQEDAIPRSAYIIDGFAKIFSAYLIYQLISAFRKYGKKSD